ncbi:MAG TPA: SLC13 family permease [Aliidongia sp.]|uniref:SLC13 family permease n=1 Tax=Aliidongia sp. TaxID=1914230 RepID=UPI002DDCA60D|nr:SLC13 family permease [Aliidongia sp.]HEV2675815.1 SLC13 family permease [Aliidongia sp.]
MPLNQIEAFVIVGAMLALFVWDRLRYDLVAAMALLAAMLTGIVPAAKAFEGFSNQVIIIIASVLVVSRAIARSGVIDAVLRRMMQRITSPSAQIGLLSGCVTFLSAFMKNVGTLGIFIPIAIQTAGRSKRSASIYLMPLAFGSLIGGTITLIGTSPNLLISTVRQQIEGKPFQLFDFVPVGLPLSVLALGFLAFGWRLIPQRTGQRPAEDAFDVDRYTSELLVAEGSPMVGKTVSALEAMGEGDLTVAAVVRGGRQRAMPPAHWEFIAGDLVAVQADPTLLKKLADEAKLEVAGAERLAESERQKDDVIVVEAVVTDGSLLIDRTATGLHLRQRFDVNLLAVSRAGERLGARLHRLRFRAGDVVALQGWEQDLPAILAELGCLPLADRRLTLGQKRTGYWSLAILVVAMILVAFNVIPVVTAFFGSAVLVVLSRQITLKDAYGAIEWPVIVMLGCLIPVGEALKETGGTEHLSHALSAAAQFIPAWATLGLVLGTAMLVTPLLHHAAAVLVLGPVAASVAHNLGYSPDAFLMAVALGCSCDFLTPIGHQNNTLVMGPGGYRFSDYWRLGLPLSILVLLVGTPLILAVWPLH